MGVPEATVAGLERTPRKCDCRGLAKIHATFDDPNLVSRAGLVPVMALAQRAGLADLVAEHVRIGHRCGVNAQVKVPCLAAGMIAGADSIDDMGLLRHGAMPALFGGIRAPSTLGSFLRAFTWGNVLQLEKVSRLLLADLAGRVPLLPGKDTVAFLDIDSTQRRVYGHKKQGAAFGHTKIQGKSLLVRGLNALAATISTPPAAPVAAGTRLRGGNAASARGAASFAAAPVSTARAAGCTGILIARADSAFYSAAFTGAVRRAGAFFSVTVQMNPEVKAAIAAIPDTAWTPIRYPRAIWDDQLRRWVSDCPMRAITAQRQRASTARTRTSRRNASGRKATPTIIPRSLPPETSPGKRSTEFTRWIEAQPSLGGAASPDVLSARHSFTSPLRPGKRDNRQRPRKSPVINAVEPDDNQVFIAQVCHLTG